MSATGAPPRARSGFTLVELLIVMVMMGVVGGALVSVFNGQQRFARATSEVGAARMQMQIATAVLPADLRMISPVGNDILAMSDSSITVRSTITTSVVCAVAGGVVTLAPVTAADSYTHVMTPPVIGDSVFIWFDNSPTMSGDDVWGTAANPVLPYRIAAVATTPGGCPRLFAAVGNTLPAYALTLDAPRAFSIGAPVRVTRPITYGLYQAATDNQWYLGLKTRGDAQYQFLAGPFRSYAAPGGPSGLQLRYYDNAGAVTTTKTQVARVGVTVRTQGVSPLTLGGATAPTPFRDSLLVGIALRNRVP